MIIFARCCVSCAAVQGRVLESLWTPERSEAGRKTPLLSHAYSEVLVRARNQWYMMDMIPYSVRKCKDRSYINMNTDTILTFPDRGIHY